MIALPVTDNSQYMQIVPSQVPLAKTYDTSISAETEVVLNTATKLIEVSAIGTPILGKWKAATGGTAVSTSAYDILVQAGATRHYGVPPGITIVTFIEQAASATLSVIEY